MRPAGSGKCSQQSRNECSQQGSSEWSLTSIKECYRISSCNPICSSPNQRNKVYLANDHYWEEHIASMVLCMKL